MIRHDELQNILQQTQTTSDLMNEYLRGQAMSMLNSIPQQRILPSKQYIKTVRGDYSDNIKDMDVLVVYGDVLGNIINCKDVIVINGDVKGNITKCENVSGLLADKE